MVATVATRFVLLFISHRVPHAMELRAGLAEAVSVGRRELQVSPAMTLFLREPLAMWTFPIGTGPAEEMPATDFTVRRVLGGCLVGRWCPRNGLATREEQVRAAVTAAAGAVVVPVVAPKGTIHRTVINLAVRGEAEVPEAAAEATATAEVLAADLSVSFSSAERRQQFRTIEWCLAWVETAVLVDLAVQVAWAEVVV
jgi:hypothetical protein